MGRRGGKKKQKKAIEQKDRQEVRNEQKKKNKNSANQEEDPQEVRNEQKKKNSIPENDQKYSIQAQEVAGNLPIKKNGVIFLDRFQLRFFLHSTCVNFAHTCSSGVTLRKCEQV